MNITLILGFHNNYFRGSYITILTINKYSYGFPWLINIYPYLQQFSRSLKNETPTVPSIVEVHRLHPKQTKTTETTWTKSVR